MKSNILVTGGTGMVGRHLKEIMPDAIYIGSNIDLRDWISVDALFNSDGLLVIENQEHN